MESRITEHDVLTRDEVMDRLRIGRSVFYRIIRSGKLKSYRDGNRIKVPASSLEEYIRERLEVSKNE